MAEKIASSTSFAGQTGLATHRRTKQDPYCPPCTKFKWIKELSIRTYTLVLTKVTYERVYFGSISRNCILSWQEKQEHRTAGYIVLNVSWRAMDTGASSHSPLYKAQNPSPWDSANHTYGVFFVSTNPT